MKIKKYGKKLLAMILMAGMISKPMIVQLSSQWVESKHTVSIGLVVQKK